MAVLLRIIDGPQAGSSHELREGQRVILGRGDRADFRILDSWASRTHCAVTYRPEGVIVEDLNTKNGTYVNGKQVDRARLPDGSLVQVGTTTVQVLVQATRRTVLAPSGLPLRSRVWRVALAIAAVVGVVAVMVLGIMLLLSQGKGGGSFFGGATPRATLQITSEPVGATVFIDEEVRGVTPFDAENNVVEVPLGEHALRVWKAGYEVYRASLNITSRNPAPIHVVLRTAERGTLVITSKPDGASVHLDGDYRGNTPLRLEDLEAQTYSLRVSKVNFADWQQEVTVKPRQEVAIEVPLGRREVGFYEAELRKDPNNVAYRAEVAHLYLLEHKVEQCMAHLSAAIEAVIGERDTSKPEPYAARLLQLLAKMYFNDHFSYGDAAFVEATRARIDLLLAEEAGKHTDSSFVLSAAQSLYKRAGTSVAEKAAAYEAKAKGAPGELSHTLTAVGFLILAHEHARAEALLQAACAAVPNDPKPWLALGRFHLGAKRRGVTGAREKAIEALNAALQRCKTEEEKAEARRLLGQATG
ncbi:MAG: PEGA domain-containing protein [Planctomycetes bacterium]|nr:PEGA domain-containing protein [Planctomycetota bacterium]